MMRYFEGLNSLRFFAAVLVAISHAVKSVHTHHCSTIYDFSSYSIFQNGTTSVEFFFVLSGFLITSLLLDENRLKGDINIISFYKRRILRIWPLYYLMVLLYFIVIPVIVYCFHLHLATNMNMKQLMLYIVFLPNVVRVLYIQTMIGHLWSIGVEEQFYLIWAPLIKFFKSSLLWIFIAIILFKLCFNILFISDHLLSPQTGWSAIIRFIIELKFESMAIGGLGAYAVRQTSDLSHLKLFNKSMQIVFIGFLVVILCFKSLLLSSTVGTFILNDSIGLIIRSFLFLYLIVNISLNSGRLFHLNQLWLFKLGMVSYGIYMYHVTVEMFLLNVFKSTFDQLSTLPSTMLYYSSFLFLTILISNLSYHLFEKWFLKLKKGFTIRKPLVYIIAD